MPTTKPATFRGRDIQKVSYGENLQLPGLPGQITLEDIKPGKGTASPDMFTDVFLRVHIRRSLIVLPNRRKMSLSFPGESPPFDQDHGHHGDFELVLLDPTGPPLDFKLRIQNRWSVMPPESDDFSFSMVGPSPGRTTVRLLCVKGKRLLYTVAT